MGAPAPEPATNPAVPAGAITEVDAPRVLSYAWLHDGADAGLVRWELSAHPKRVHRVLLTQTVPGTRADALPELLAALQARLEVFFARVLGAEERPWPQARAEAMRARYAERLAF